MLMRLMTLATWLMLIVCFLAGAAIAMAAPMTGMASVSASKPTSAAKGDRDQDIYEFDHLPPPTGATQPPADAVHS
ncbi:hypothetical protein ACFPL7_08175 [Dongia soli]|uniref:Uncharacterized protein n=1 Tax=Dongia soli TaxID=600628 RepID=A0ABU5EAI9_9PROT|nr:hypothetical protein [Dongia soli]MDY0882922.1 hypothetical protein [Dongia soli]